MWKCLVQILAFALTLIVCGIFLIKLLFLKNPEVKRRSHEIVIYYKKYLEEKIQ